jgi:hypothetical protein
MAILTWDVKLSTHYEAEKCLTLLFVLVLKMHKIYFREVLYIQHN